MATIRSEQPAMTALPAKQRPLTIAMRGTRPDSCAHSLNARASSAETDGIVGVARPSAAAFGEEHGRQPHPLDQFEEAVLLAVAEGALGAGEHRVVVGQHGAGAALVAEEVAVDARGARHQPVGRGARDQVVEVAAVALGGDGEPSVLDERVRVDEVVDVLPGGAAVRRVPALDRVGPGRVLGQRPAPQQLGVVVADRPHQTWRLMLTTV